MAWTRLALLRLRDERLSALGLATLVLATAFAAAATPRLIDRVSDDALRSIVLEAPSIQRNIRFITQDHLESAIDDQFAEVNLREANVYRQLPASIAALVSERGWMMESGRWRLPQVPGDPATVRIRIEPGAMDRMRLVDGHWPTAATDRVPDGTSTDPVPPDVTAFEAALSTATAASFRLHVGDVLTLVPDTSDPDVNRIATLNIAVHVVGIYEVLDELDPWWINDTTVARPAIRFLGGDAQSIDATAILSPDAYNAYVRESLRGGQLNRYTYREYVDPGRLAASNIDGLVTDFKRLEAAFPTTTRPLLQPFGGTPSLSEGLRALLERYQAQWAAASAILTIGGIGPAAVALGALALVAGLAARRRQFALALARGRGASGSQVVRAVVAEGLLLGVPAALVAVVLAVVLVPAHALLASYVAAVAVTALAILLLVIATVPATSGPAFGSGREVAVARPSSARRLLFEALVVVLALVGAALLRERGLRGVSSAGQLGQPDPFVAAVPALIGIAAGLLVVRLFPFPMRALAWFARRGRSLVPVLALRRASDRRRVGPALVVLLVTAAIWAFSSSVLLYLDRAADAVAWRDTGAAYRIDSRTAVFPVTFDPTKLPEVQAAAGAHRDLTQLGPRHLLVQVIALSVKDYEAVTAATPAALDLPLDFYPASVPVIPIMVSQAVADRTDGVKPGDEFDAYVEGYIYPMRVIGIIGDVPGMATSAQFAIASRDQMVALRPSALLKPTVFYARAPGAAEGAIRTAVAAAVPVSSSVVAQAAEAARIRSTPIARAVVAGITAAALIAFGYAVLAVAASLALTGAGQALEIAHLRTLGLSNRQAAGLILVENGPVVVTAFGLGLGLGLATFAFLRQGLGLEALIGARADVSLAPDPGQLAVLLGGIVAVIVLGLAAGTLMQRGAVPTAAVRRGFE